LIFAKFRSSFFLFYINIEFNTSILYRFAFLFAVDLSLFIVQKIAFSG